MNRNLSLILSALVVVVLLAVWIYLLLNPRTTANQDQIEGSGAFSEFEFGDTTDGSVANGEQPSTNEQMDENGEYRPDILRQLTTRKVIGYQEVLVASTTHVYFMESGVGHVYSIDLSDGTEDRVTATTIPDAREAAFSFDGTLVAIKTGESRGAGSLLLGVINTEDKSLEFEPFTENVSSFTFIETGELLYAKVNNSSVSVHAYDFDTKKTTLLFTTPFRESVVLLGNTTGGPHYFYPKTSQFLESFVYKVENGSFERLTLDGYAFTAIGAGDTVYASFRDNSTLKSTRFDSNSNTSTDINNTIVPEKCVEHQDVLFCAIPTQQLRYTSIDEWYKGNISFSDNLWMLGEQPESLIDITNFTGRLVDVTNGHVGVLSNDWYFQNKTDESLWVYELSDIFSSN